MSSKLKFLKEGFTRNVDEGINIAWPVLIGLLVILISPFWTPLWLIGFISRKIQSARRARKLKIAMDEDSARAKALLGEVEDA